MNRVALIGRLVDDPDIRWTQGNESMCIARYRLAVDRKVKKDGGQSADFIGCVCFGKTAEWVEKYLHKGIKIGVTGRIQTGSYDHKDGYKVYTTDVVVDEHTFCSTKAESAQAAQVTNTDQHSDFTDIPDDIQEQLPFN